VKSFEESRKYRNMRSEIGVPTTATQNLNLIPHLIILVKGQNISVPKTASKIFNYSQKIKQKGENLRVNARRSTTHAIKIKLIIRSVYLWQNALQT
jgi:hypothetical protein